MDLELYNKLLKIRGLFNKVQQISWQSNQLAKKFPIDQLTKEEQLKLLNFYFEMLPDLRDILNQLESEYETNRPNTAE